MHGQGPHFSQHCRAASAPAHSCRVAVPRGKGKVQCIVPEPDCPARRDRAACVMPRERQAAWNPVQGFVPRAPTSRAALCRSGATGAWKQGGPVHVVCCYCGHLGVDRHAVHGNESYGHADAADLLFLVPKYMLLVGHVGWSSIAPSSCRSVQQACGLQCYTAGLFVGAWSFWCKNSLRCPKHEVVQKYAQLLHILLPVCMGCRISWASVTFTPLENGRDQMQRYSNPSKTLHHTAYLTDSY